MSRLIQVQQPRDIYHRQIHVRKQISIWCNRIEHWVHLMCAGIRLSQYTDTWTCHVHKESRLTTHTDITPSHPQSLVQATNPFPTYTTHNTTTQIQTHLTHYHRSDRIGKAQHHTQLRTPNTYTLHTLHLQLSPHAPHSSLVRRLYLTQHLKHVYLPYSHNHTSPGPHTNIATTLSAYSQTNNSARITVNAITAPIGCTKQGVGS